MKLLAPIFFILLFTACNPKQDIPTYYNKYDVVMQYRTNMQHVQLAFTNTNHEVAYGELSNPGIDYVYNEMKSGDVVYVYAVSADTSGYINAQLTIKDVPVQFTSAVYDSVTNCKINMFNFVLP